MESHAYGVNCQGVEWVKRNMLRWFGYIERKGSEEFVKKVYMSVDPNSRGRPLGRWRDRVRKYMCERCYQGEKAGSSKEGVLGQGEMEILLWPPPWRTLTEGVRWQSYR